MNTQVKKAQAPTGFDVKFYDTLTPENRVAVKQKTTEIKEHLRHTAQNIREIGQRLVDVRSRLKYGQFDSWLKFEFDWSRRTAYNFINVYETFGNCANFAQITIPISALYLLAAPSTPLKIRSEFLERAMAGQKVSHKSILRAIKEVDVQLASNNAPVDSSKLTFLESKLATTPPKVEVEDKTSVFEHLQSKPFSASLTIINSITRILPGWYLLDNTNILFCGDTASTEFIECVPQAAFALAIPSSKKSLDWLIKKARAVTVLKEAELDEALIERLLLMFSERKETVIFPYLPNWKILRVAQKLERKFYTGDSDPERCNEVVMKLGLKAKRVNL